ncbi:MAG: protein kinase, partial [Anaerolineae bacterium]|nr:protein kinase [Anaerolineae bacterium]
LMPTPLTRLEPVPGGKVIILKPAGIFDETVATELTTELKKLKGKSNWAPQLVVDMSEVEMLQVAGLRALVRIRKEQQSSPMVLAAPSLNVQQLIELAGYLDFFAIYPSVHTALNALKAHETLNLPGQIIKGRYNVTSKVGDGRLGTVFQAIDTRQNRSVALKILSPSFSEGAIEQFLNQARQIIDLIHPNIVQIYDCDEDRGLSYMVEEYIEGQTLRDLIDEAARQPLPIDMAISIAEHITHGLEYAHSHGVIHGDLKPKNVLIWNDQIKISDFGLGRLESGHKSLISIDVPLAMVSARYVAPEQILGHPIDARTDLYALGAILFELFTGRPLFEGTEEEVLHWQRNAMPPSPCDLNPHLSRSLEHLILKLLDKDPNKRYAKASQVRRILTSIVTPARSRFARQTRPAFVGNQPALQQLTDLWGKTEQGQGQVVFIKGEAGLGKTRLAYELAQRVGRTTLLVGQCRRLNESPAYQPFVEAVETYFATTPTAVAGQQVGAVLGQLGQMLPEIGQIFLEAQSPVSAVLAASALPSETGAFDEPDSLISEFISSPSLANLIGQAAKQQPWLLILDDLHAADQNTLQLFAYLSRHCHQMRLMVVGIYQETQLAMNELLAELLDSLGKLDNATTIGLRALTEREIEQLLNNLWLQAVPKSLTAAIYRRSQGNPFFAEEIAQGLVDDNVVSWRDNKWHFASVLESSLPRDLAGAILHRINRLSKETQALLHQAAVLGRTFRFTDLHEVSDLSEWDALESLDIALERHLLKEVAGEQVLHFKHVAVQDVFIQNLSQLKRQLMHREAGEALERRAQLDEPTRNLAVALAHHFYQAGEYRKALTYSRQAAQLAEQVYAGHMALGWYTQALDALDQLNQGLTTDLERFDLLLSREKLYGYLGNVSAQAAELLALQTSAQLLDDPVRQSIGHNRQAAHDLGLGHYNEAKAEAHAALIMARQTAVPLLKGESLLQAAQILAAQGDYTAALEQVELAQKALDKTDKSWPGLGALHNVLGTIYFGLHDLEQARTHFQQAVLLDRSFGNWPGQALSLAWLGRVYLGLQWYGGAKSLCDRSLEMSRAIGYPRGEAVSLQYSALIYQALGQDKLAQAFVDQALPLHRRLQDLRGEVEALKLLGAIQRGMEDYAAAHYSLSQAYKLTQPLKVAALEAEISFEMGLTFERQEQVSEAQAAYETAHRLHQTAANRAGEIEARAGLARCLLANNNLAAAEAAIMEISTWLDEYGLSGVHYPVQLYLTNYRVLRAANKGEAAKKALEICQRLIQQRAETIEQEVDNPEDLSLLLSTGAA